MNKLVAEAFARLFQAADFQYHAKTRFSRKFSPYNANVKKFGNTLTFSFSPEWRKVSSEITIGLIQELLLRILRKKGTTTNIELYNSFIKNLHISAKKTETDEILAQIFGRVNEKYFNSAVDMPNLRWGQNSARKLAAYDYHTDTITVSSAFRNAEPELIAYLLYHEMLHKQLKFSSAGSRTIHHSRKFRQMEKQFENSQQLEKQLNSRAGKNRRIGWLMGWI
ncbi:M48 family metallopeptidase [Candidatus Woesearchaeota archaeon]|nr:M48 family metallopeptidase [Candidatus Woesearchaeota archaeon]